MIINDFYDSMFKRKSVRKYNFDSLKDETLSEIKTFSNEVKRLIPDIKTEMRFVSRDEIKLILPIKAPHYLMFYSEKKEDYLTNAGFMLQQIDLFLSTNGIGSCYLGMAQPTQVAKDSSELDFVIVLAFGNALETVHRLNLAAYKRKQIGEIAHHINDLNFQYVVEAARVAPSASNSQPWFFVHDDEMIHVYRNKPGVIKAFLYDKMNQLDMGIVLYHMSVALEHKNIKYQFIETERGLPFITKSQIYTRSVELLK